MKTVNKSKFVVVLFSICFMSLCQLSAEDTFTMYQSGENLFLLDKATGRVWSMENRDEQQVLTPVLFNNANGFLTLFPPTPKEDLVTESSLIAKREQALKEVQKKLLEQKLKALKDQVEKKGNEEK